MPGSQFDLAVIGADDPQGEAVLRLLEEREIAVGTLYPLSLGDAEDSVEFAGASWPCSEAEGFDYSRAQAVLIASHAPAAQRLAETVRAGLPAMPVAGVTEVLPAAAVAVARVLKHLAAVAGVESAEAVVNLPVALYGRAGVEELSAQTRGLFNLDAPDPETFPTQIAFNLMPLPEADYDARLAAASRSLLGDAFEVGFSTVLAPLFFGAAAMLHVRCEQPTSLEQLRRACAHAEGITLMESDLPAGIPTPATDAADSDDVFIGRLQLDEKGRHVKLWLVFDPIRLTAAGLAAAVENWIDKPANSMLT